ncbi:MAG: hypothetical protein JKX85_10805 [Phycisphaeraceae bacterium]|nr:hypothetical protein [Phycisphaeraceae bacterium]
MPAHLIWALSAGAVALGISYNRKTKTMYQCGKEIKQYHDGNVTLGKTQRDEMRDRRNNNRQRLKQGLHKNNDPYAIGQWTQGSYAMWTMIQDEESDYDIDDGVYFDLEDLKGSSGADKTALDARKMVCAALQQGNFTTPPEVKTNCVRVHYQAGFHVDIPVYRRWEEENIWGDTVKCQEIASANWKSSDPLAVTNWFKDTVKEKSPADDNTQFRRIVRMMKKFSKSRKTWKKKMPSGFTLSKLAEEKYVACSGDDEQALHKTMKAIQSRLDRDLAVKHPVLNEWLAEEDCPKTSFLKTKLADNLQHLVVLEQNKCSKTDALRAWRKVFKDSFFKDKADTCDEDAKRISAAVCEHLGYDSDTTLVENIRQKGLAFLQKLHLNVNYMENPAWTEIGNIPVKITATLHDEEGAPEISSLSSGDVVGPDLHIKFDVTVANGIFPKDWKVYWRVTNTGNQATNEKQLRGDFQTSKNRYNWEHTQFLGVHWVEAFVVKNRNQCVGRSDRFYVAIG